MLVHISKPICHYPFTIEDIIWPDAAGHLPDTSDIILPSELVDKTDVNDGEWDEAIFKALTSKHGLRPAEFGSFGPNEDD